LAGKLIGNKKQSKLAAEPAAWTKSASKVEELWQNQYKGQIIFWQQTTL